MSAELSSLSSPHPSAADEVILPLLEQLERGETLALAGNRTTYFLQRRECSDPVFAGTSVELKVAPLPYPIHMQHSLLAWKWKPFAAVVIAAILAGRRLDRLMCGTHISSWTDEP